MCALFSQLGKHQDALLAAKQAAAICFEMIRATQMLSKRFVQKIQRANQHQPKESSDFVDICIDESISQNSNEYQSIRTPLKRNPSGDSRNSMNSDQVAGVVKLKIVHGFSQSSSRGPSVKREQSSSVESLDRIHTFSLKNATRKVQQR